MHICHTAKGYAIILQSQYHISQISYTSIYCNHKANKWEKFKI